MIVIHLSLFWFFGWSDNMIKLVIKKSQLVKFKIKSTNFPVYRRKKTNTSLMHSMTEIKPKSFGIPFVIKSSSFLNFECIVYTTCKRPLRICFEIHSNQLYTNSVNFSLLEEVKNIFHLFVSFCEKYKCFYYH